MVSYFDYYELYVLLISLTCVCFPIGLIVDSLKYSVVSEIKACVDYHADSSSSSCGSTHNRFYIYQSFNCTHLYIPLGSLQVFSNFSCYGESSYYTSSLACYALDTGSDCSCALKNCNSGYHEFSYSLTSYLITYLLTYRRLVVLMFLC